MVAGRHGGSTAGVFVILAVLSLSWSSCTALFPRACARNATQPDAVCCPPMPNDPYGPICGGRGQCVRIPTVTPSQTSRVPVHLRNDDRLDWPHAFFSYSCSCSGNFIGYACHRCKPGWWGDNCKIRGVRRTRRNAVTMTKNQKDYFREVLYLSKYMPSDWVVPNITSRQNGDPISKLSPFVPFYEVSVYNLIIYLHLYSARSTLLTDDMRQCPPLEHLDFSHRGSAFPSWHRYYLYEVESMLDDVAKSETSYPEPFAIPYWDWIDGINCSACTNDLVGAINESSPQHRIDVRSDFYDWKRMCPHRIGLEDCHVCDPTVPQSFLFRSYSTDPKVQKLTTQAELDFIMSRKVFDVSPYDVTSNSSSFRNNLEGFINADNSPSHMNNYMHNLAHMYLNASLNDVAASPNDPLFILLHSFVDKVYEVWMRNNGANCKNLPLEANVGHSRFDPMVPFFPRVVLCDGMKLSDDFGFQYDNYILGSKKYFHGSK